MLAEDYLPLLKRSHLCTGLTDEQILDFAQALHAETRAAGAVIFKQEAEGDNFYLIERGQVQMTRQAGKQPRPLATLVAGDYFGAAALLHSRRRFATLTAQTETRLLRLGKEEFLKLLQRYPQIRLNVQASIETRQLLSRLKFKWLVPSEVVYLIARRHPILLAQALLPPLAVWVLVLLAALAANVLRQPQLALWLALLGSLPLAAWAGWNWLDWGNDFYIVTNQRVVYLEKVVGFYDSRQESPLASILSVNVQSAGALERSLDMGDVIVRTFSGPIVMNAVPHPQVLAATVEEHWRRAKFGGRRAERETIRQALHRRLQTNLEPEEALNPPPPPPSPPQRRPLGESLARFFSFKVRFEEGDYITYRKHPFLLLRDVSLPTLLLLLLAVGGGGALLQGWVPAVFWLMAVLVALVVFIFLAGWWLYEYVDWRNDIYQIATDQIIDIYRKPLGREVRKAAPLNNILSLRYERIGLGGLLLNYGNVIANIGSAEFKFEGVFDPMGVQSDIYRRMEALAAQKAQAEINKRRDEISDWISAYHAVVTEARQAGPPPEPPAAP